MKYKLLSIIITGLLFVSCGEDRSHEADRYTEVQRWIDGVMREYYLWYDEIPEPESLNYFNQPPAFFNSLLSSNDGKNGARYSTIIDNSETTTRNVSASLSYGLEFSYEQHPVNRRYIARILYVLPNSPAEDAGLVRGEFITSINEADLNTTNVALLLGTTVPLNLTIGTWDETEENIVERRNIELTNTRLVENNPVYLDTIYQHAGKQIGYLVYNHFTTGYSETDTNYDTQLKEISNIFSSANIDELILDLRYNGGGVLSSAQLLCGLLAPETELGNTLGYLQFNDKQTPQVLSFNMERAFIEGGTNLNMNRVYVIVNRITASASEMVINSLSPFMDVILIGAQTEGKNVGSHVYTSDIYPWELHPIDCMIFNSVNESEYVNGFEPDYLVNEFSVDNMNSFIALGDVNETMLRTTLSVIDGTYQEEEPETRTGNNIPVWSSLDTKFTTGVIIR